MSTEAYYVDYTKIIQEKVSTYWVETKLQRIIENKKTVTNNDLIGCLTYLNYKIESLQVIKETNLCNKFYKKKTEESIKFYENLYEKCRNILKQRKCL